jgi:hypothetical protein
MSIVRVNVPQTSVVFKDCLLFHVRRVRPGPFGTVTTQPAHGFDRVRHHGRHVRGGKRGPVGVFDLFLLQPFAWTFGHEYVVTRTLTVVFILVPH